MADKFMITLIAKTTFDSKTFIQKSKDLLDRSITRLTDRESMKPDPGNLDTYVALLYELYRENNEINSVLREPNHILKFIDYTFLLEGSRQLFYELAESTNLQLSKTKQKNFGVIKGSLYDYYMMTTVLTHSLPIKKLSGILVLFFEREGFNLWGHFKKTTKDGFLLLEKR